jgi:hypothetical protein
MAPAIGLGFTQGGTPCAYRSWLPWYALSPRSMRQRCGPEPARWTSPHPWRADVGKRRPAQTRDWHARCALRACAGAGVGRKTPGAGHARPGTQLWPTGFARRQNASSGISCLFVAASHTHSAPVVQDEYKSASPALEQAALDKIGRAIEEASSGLAEACIGTGNGVAYITHNRLHVNADGSVSLFEHNVTRIPTAPVDPTVSVIRVDKINGSALAILTQYACHPVVFGSDNLQYSADFPGVMKHLVEERTGGHAVSFFLQGASGDINPYYAVTPIMVTSAIFRPSRRQPEADMEPPAPVHGLRRAPASAWLITPWSRSMKCWAK